MNKTSLSVGTEEALETRIPEIPEEEECCCTASSPKAPENHVPGAWSGETPEETSARLAEEWNALSGLEREIISAHPEEAMRWLDWIGRWSGAADCVFDGHLVNEYDCDRCPHNREWDNSPFPCGQQHCWVTATCRGTSQW